MRYILCVLFAGVLAFDCRAQVVAIQNDKMNILYVCVGNPLTIAAENTFSKSLVVTTDNGKIHPDSFGRKGSYIIFPEHAGKATVYVKKRTPKGLKTIGHIGFRVRYWPAPVVRLGDKKGGDISQALLCAMIAPGTRIEEMDICAHIPIIEFTVIVKRRNKEIFRRTTVGKSYARIDTITNDFFQRLHNNDVVIFKDMMIRNNRCFSSNKLSDSLVFTITDAHKYHKPYRPKHGREVIIDPVTGEETIKRW